MENNRSPEEILRQAQEMLNRYNNILLQHLLHLQEAINKQTDNRKKHVGDRVIVWDRSWATCVNGELCEDEINDHECIVTDVNQNYKAVCKYGNPNTCDLIVWSPKFQKLIYTLSECVKLVDYENIQRKD